jgi:hypothetical protein
VEYLHFGAVVQARAGAEVFNQKSERSSGEIPLLFASERQSARVLRTMMVPDFPCGFAIKKREDLWQQ